MSVADSIEGRREHITLYASFDEGLDAKVSRGDRTATVEPLVLKHDPDGGRFGGAADGRGGVRCARGLSGAAGFVR